MSRATNIDKYVDAVRGLRALEQARRDDGQERKEEIKAARVMVAERLRPLSGGDLGKANRILYGPSGIRPQPTEGAFQMVKD